MNFLSNEEHSINSYELNHISIELECGPYCEDYFIEDFIVFYPYHIQILIIPWMKVGSVVSLCLVIPYLEQSS